MQSRKTVVKPWGREEWVVVTDKYAMKIIVINKGARTSLQYHNRKQEHFYVDAGLLRIELEEANGKMATLTLKPGDGIEIKAGRKHRATALEDLRLIEVSTPELDDVVRVEDDYNRS
jgi:mannose-6-phosphate isomerase